MAVKLSSVSAVWIPAEGLKTAVTFWSDWRNGSRVLIHISRLRRVSRIRHALDLAQSRVMLFGIDEDRRAQIRIELESRKTDIRLAGIRRRTRLISDRRIIIVVAGGSRLRLEVDPYR